MAARPIDVQIQLDSSGVERGANHAADAFEALDRQIRAAGPTADHTGDSISNAARDAAQGAEHATQQMQESAQDAAQRIDRDLTQALHSVQQEGERAGRGVGDSMHHGAQEAGEATRTIRDEARQNLSETVSSFRGDIEDIPQLLQDISGGVVSDLGPMGLALGTAIAAGLGIGVAMLQKNAEEVAKNKQLVLDLAQAIQDAGGNLADVDFESRMQDWGKAIQDTKEWWEVFQDDAKTGFEVIQERAKKTGEVWTDAFRGTHGTMDESKDYLQKTADQYDALQKKIDEAGVVTNEYGQQTSLASQELLNARDALKQNREDAQKNVEQQEKAAAVQSSINDLTATGTRHWHGYSDAEKAAQQSAENVTKAKREQLDAIKAVSDEQDRQIGKVKDSITAEVDLAQKYADQKQNIIDNGASIDLNTEAGRKNRQGIVDIATAIVDQTKAHIANGMSIADATAEMEAQRQKFIDTAVAAGFSKDEAAKMADQLGLTPKNVETKFSSNVAEEKQKIQDYQDTQKKTPSSIFTDVNVNGIPDAEEQLRQFVTKGRHISVDVLTGDVSAVENYITGMDGKKVYVDIVPRNGVGITN